LITSFAKKRFSFKAPSKPQVDRANTTKPRTNEAPNTPNLIVLSKW